MPPLNATSSNSSDFSMDIANITDGMNFTENEIQYSQPIETAPVYLFCSALSLAAISAFLRAGFVLKFLCMLCCIAVQGCVLFLSDLYTYYNHEVNRTRYLNFSTLTHSLIL